jgi:nicotinate-nucleotide adenylyltransferase
VIGLKIGFLGGSFDPVHFGHLLAAQDAYEQCKLDRLIFVPAAQAPLKSQEMQASSGDRLAMLRAAVAGDSRFEISEVELQRGGVSYTIDTVRHFRVLFPDAELYWIIGGDQLPRMGLWKEAAELVRMIEFILLERPGHPADQPPDIPGLRLLRRVGRLIEISSSEIRDRSRRGLPLQYLCPQEVISLIEVRSLYRQIA